jgi:2TM domain
MTGILCGRREYESTPSDPLRSTVGQESGRWRVAVVVKNRLQHQSDSVDLQGSHMLIQKLRLQRGWSQEQLVLLNANATPTVSPDEALALRRVRKLKAFYIHLTQYIVVITILAAVNMTTNRNYLWFLWAALGWGVGVLSHALITFDKLPFLSGEWERRQVEKQLGRKL